MNWKIFKKINKLKLFNNIKKFYEDLKLNTKDVCLYFIESNSDDTSVELLEKYSK